MFYEITYILQLIIFCFKLKNYKEIEQHNLKKFDYWIIIDLKFIIFYCLQDYYCDLSPLQEQLYEDFTHTQAHQSLTESLGKQQNTSNIQSNTHIFQVCVKKCYCFKFRVYFCKKKKIWIIVLFFKKINIFYFYFLIGIKVSSECLQSSKISTITSASRIWKDL